MWEPGRFGEQVRALVLAAIPLFAGFLTILVDDRWRGVHDMIAGTVVIGVADPPLDRSRDERAPGSPHPR